MYQGIIETVEVHTNEGSADLAFEQAVGIPYPKGRDTYEKKISYTNYDGSNIYINDIEGLLVKPYY